ncbi:hypothetical protein E2320_014021, partial [Naja naja]
MENIKHSMEKGSFCGVPSSSIDLFSEHHSRPSWPLGLQLYIMDLEALPEEPEGPVTHAVYPPTRTGSLEALRMAPGIVISTGEGWITTSEAGVWLIQLTLAPGAMPRLPAVVDQILLILFSRDAPMSRGENMDGFRECAQEQFQHAVEDYNNPHREK